MEGSVEFPSDVQERMRSLVVRDLDVRVTELTSLVALQESELVLLWVVILCGICYVTRKDYRARTRDS